MKLNIKWKHSLPKLPEYKILFTKRTYLSLSTSYLFNGDSGVLLYSIRGLYFFMRSGESRHNHTLSIINRLNLKCLTDII